VPVADRVDQDSVLVLRDHEDLARARQHRLRGKQRAGRGERQHDDRGDRPRQRRAARQIDECRVVGVVQVDVPDERLRREVLHDLVELLGQFLERLELLHRLEALGGKPCGGALEHAAQLDRVADVGEREGADDEAAAVERLEQALVRKGGQREAQRRPRDAEPLGQRDLRDPLARAELALEHELPHAERRLGHLGVVASAPRHVRSIGRQALCMQ
jgi:hypothetical protein